MSHGRSSSQEPPEMSLRRRFAVNNFLKAALCFPSIVLSNSNWSNGPSKKISKQVHFYFFRSDRKRIANGTERRPFGSRTDPERTPYGPRTDPVRPSNGPRADPARTPRGPRANPARTPNGLRTGPERTPNGPRTDPGATKSSPKTCYSLLHWAYNHVSVCN